MERRAEGRCTVSCTCLLGSKRKHWSKALSRHISNLYTSCWWNGPQDKQHNWPDFDLSGGAFTSGVLGVLSCKLILQQEQNILCKYKQRGQIGAKLVEDLFQRWRELAEGTETALGNVTWKSKILGCFNRISCLGENTVCTPTPAGPNGLWNVVSELIKSFKIIATVPIHYSCA